MIGLVTAIYDDYDTLRTVPPQSVEVDAVCVTDNPRLNAPGWRIVHAPRLVGPNLAGKFPKTCPWHYTDAEASVWIDASFRVTSSTFVADVVALADPLAMFTHPDRDCIYQEVAHSATLTRYEREPLHEQAECYRQRGHPEHWGLWANGVIARRHTPPVVELGEQWLAECERWSIQDQVSFAPTLRPLGFLPTPLPGSFQWNEWLTYEASGRHS